MTASKKIMIGVANTIGIAATIRSFNEPRPFTPWIM